jgi:hypothetical protein
MGTFDLEETYVISWQLEGAGRLEYIHMSCLDDDNIVYGNANSFCKTGTYGHHYEYTDICRSITILDSSMEGFNDRHGYWQGGI